MAQRVSGGRLSHFPSFVLFRRQYLGVEASAKISNRVIDALLRFVLSLKPSNVGTWLQRGL